MNNQNFQIQWLDDGVWKNYNPMDTNIINEAFYKNKDHAEIKSPNGQLYKVDFKSMCQINKSTGYYRRIRFVGEPHPETKNQIFDKYNIIDNSTLDKDETCSLCICEFEENDIIIQFEECKGHFFHKKCEGNMDILNYILKHPQCPVCKKSYGTIVGNMPTGFMNVQKTSQKLLGYENYGTIIIDFIFPEGIQDETHPNPGVKFLSDNRVAYLPDSPEGNEVLNLFKKAWEKRLLFTIGYSLTRNRDNVIIYNGIHMKTNTHGYFGYPDLNYIKNVKHELKLKGVE